jgi:hypothetical protein
MFKKIALFLLAAVVVLAIVVATRPAHFTYSRSAKIHAPADVIYAEVSDLHKFPEWSPWAKLDPAMTASFSGPPAGVGSAYGWKGNDKVGEGRMTLKELKPNDYVDIDLEFLSPMTMKSLVEYKLQPAADGTTMTWSMSGENGFMGKAFGMVMDEDKDVGQDFERGLAQLDQVASAEVKRRTAMLVARPMAPPTVAGAAVAPVPAPAPAPAPVAVKR